jgi:thioredoxin 1
MTAQPRGGAEGCPEPFLVSCHTRHHRKSGARGAGAARGAPYRYRYALTPDHGTDRTLSSTIRGGNVSSTFLQVTEAAFDEEINGSPVPVIVEFWAEWCPPCKALAPVLDSIATDYEDRLRVLKINVDEQPELASRYQIISIPTILVFSAGELRRQMIGARSRSRLLKGIEDLVS